MPIKEMPSELVWVLVGVTTAVALAGRELAVHRGMTWLSGHWTRLVLLFAGMVALFAPAAGQVIDVDIFKVGSICVGAFVLSAIVASAVYWRVRPDFAALVIVIGFVDAFIVCIGYRVIDEGIGFDFDDVAPALTSFGAMIVWAIAATGSAAVIMRRLRSNLQGAPS